MNISLALHFKDNFLNEEENRLSDQILDHFREKLLAWRENIQKEREENLNYVLQTSIKEPDHVDSARAEINRLSHFEELTKEKELLEEIDTALERIEDGTYGFCEETGDLITVERLEAWPIARFKKDVEERHEINLNNVGLV